MALDGALGEAAAQVAEVGITDYDGFDRAADAIRDWSEVARGFNDAADVLDAAELEGGRV
jgi:hypothetical protein